MAKQKEFEKYLEEHSVEWDDLNEEQKNAFAFAHSLFVPVLNGIASELNSLEEKVSLLCQPKIEAVSSVEDFISKNRLAILDVYSDNCPACHRYNPVLDVLSGENGGVAFGKVNVEEHREVLDKFDLNAIPVIMAFKDGKLVDKVVGANPSLSKRYQKISDLVKKLRA